MVYFSIRLSCCKTATGKSHCGKFSIMSTRRWRIGMGLGRAAAGFAGSRLGDHGLLSFLTELSLWNGAWIWCSRFPPKKSPCFVSQAASVFWEPLLIWEERLIRFMQFLLMKYFKYFYCHLYFGKYWKVQRCKYQSFYSSVSQTFTISPSRNSC